MVVGDFDIGGPFGRPLKTDTVLIIYPNAVLPFSVTPQRFESIGWRRPKIGKVLCAVKKKKLSLCHSPELFR